VAAQEAAQKAPLFNKAHLIDKALVELGGLLNEMVERIERLENGNR